MQVLYMLLPTTDPRPVDGLILRSLAAHVSLLCGTKKAIAISLQIIFLMVLLILPSRKFSTDGNIALYEQGLYDFTTGKTTTISAINPDFWGFVLYDFSDSLSVVGYEQTADGAQFPVIYKDGKTQKLEDYLIAKGVDFAADGMIAPRIDSEGQYNLMIARSVSKNDSVFAFTFVDNNQNLRFCSCKNSIRIVLIRSLLLFRVQCSKAFQQPRLHGRLLC